VEISLHGIGVSPGIVIAPALVFLKSRWEVPQYDIDSPERELCRFDRAVDSSREDLVRLMDAAGKDYVVIETVGVGQDEVDVVSCVQTCCVVLVPGMGDEIQAIKAGIMEVADIFVINKADRAGVRETRRDLERGAHGLRHTACRERAQGGFHGAGEVGFHLRRTLRPADPDDALVFYRGLQFGVSGVHFLLALAEHLYEIKLLRDVIYHHDVLWQPA